MESQEEVRKVLSQPSRLNGENVAGAAFLFFSVLFMMAGQLNGVFAILYPADFMLAGFGIALVILGYRTWRNEMKEAQFHGSRDRLRY